MAHLPAKNGFGEAAVFIPRDARGCEDAMSISFWSSHQNRRLSPTHSNRFDRQAQGEWVVVRFRDPTGNRCRRSLTAGRPQRGRLQQHDKSSAVMRNCTTTANAPAGSVEL